MLIEPVYDILNFIVAHKDLFPRVSREREPFQLLFPTTKALKDSMTLKVHFEESFDDSDKLHESVTIDEMTKCHLLVMLCPCVDLYACAIDPFASLKRRILFVLEGTVPLNFSAKKHLGEIYSEMNFSRKDMHNASPTNLITKARSNL